MNKMKQFAAKFSAQFSSEMAMRKSRMVEALNNYKKGKRPSHTSGDPEEREVARWLDILDDFDEIYFSEDKYENCDNNTSENEKHTVP